MPANSVKKPARRVTPAADRATPASRLIDARIESLPDWRGATLARLREVIRSADRSITEEWKWNTPVWSSNGIVCTGETYARVVKLTFAHGASLADPAKLFNSSLTGSTRRAIDVREGERLDARALKALVKSAVAFNGSRSPADKPKRTATKNKPAKTRLLSGGNPQIAKGDGDAAVQAYIAAMPGWKQNVGRRVDAIATRVLADVPGARKAVKWNSPFYGVEKRGWLLSFHCFTHYVKIAFFNGSLLRPLPPGESKSDSTRYLDVHEHDALDEARLADWIRQASALPGWGKA